MNKSPDRFSPLNRQISRAELADLPGILSILNQNLLSKKEALDTTILQQQGFLIHGFTQEEAQGAIQDKENFVFVTTKENEDVIGYATGCNIKKLQPVFLEELDSVSPVLKENLFSQKIFYLKHIAKKVGVQKVGPALFQKLLEFVKTAGYDQIVCQISHQPFKNNASISFHERLGFSCLGESRNEDTFFGIYAKKVV